MHQITDPDIFGEKLIIKIWLWRCEPEIYDLNIRLSYFN